MKDLCQAGLKTAYVVKDGLKCLILFPPHPKLWTTSVHHTPDLCSAGFKHARQALYQWNYSPSPEICFVLPCFCFCYVTESQFTSLELAL